MKYEAIILAAGYSRRMGTLKANLPFKGKTLLDTLIDLYKLVGIPVRVVLGYEEDLIERRPGVDYLINPLYDLGMFESIKVGMRDSKASVFIHPVDCPILEIRTIRALMDAFEKRPCDVVVPTYGDKKGHPPLLSCHLKDEILAYSGQGGLRQFMDKKKVELVETNDIFVLNDIDTKADYEKLCHFR